ncbi:MAG: DNA damage-inducible protein D [Ktedonobacteraceae bacterium]|nr:DNA damage-inducible protein D [Ktedonobacteraceae bacterium]
MASEGTQSSPFDAIRHESNQYGEYWSGKELYKLLGYSSWERFKGTIERAQISCKESGQAVSEHFHIDVKMSTLGNKARRKTEDIFLSRYACYLVLQNADPNGKPLVALAQTYFAVQTRRQELADDTTLAALPEDQKRLILRNQMAILNQQLAAAAQRAGVVRAEDFALFQNHGYRALYGGESEDDIHARKQLQPDHRILDFMGSDELAYNSFRASLTKQKIEREQIQERDQANAAHSEMGAAVRQTIIQTGATLPEDLPTPAKSIQQIQREEERKMKRGPQLPLFPEEGEATPSE